MLGYVSIQSFGASTAADTRAALAALDARGAAGYVVDLRANGGGIVSAGTAACRHLTEFLETSPCAPCLLVAPPIIPCMYPVQSLSVQAVPHRTFSVWIWSSL